MTIFQCIDLLEKYYKHTVITQSDIKKLVKTQFKHNVDTSVLLHCF